MKRHIEIELPLGMTYIPGRYLQVLPTNGSENVERALTYFGLDKDDSIIIKKVSGHVRAQFPTDASVNAQQVFQCYIELNAPASRSQMKEYRSSHLQSSGSSTIRCCDRCQL